MIGSSMPASVIDAEVEDREHEHADDRREALQPVDDELARLQPEAAEQRRGDRHDDQRDERRHAF